MHTLMDRAPLSLHTAYFHDTDRHLARALGAALYGHLSRPSDDRLAFGNGIPVFSGVAADAVPLDEAEITVLIPVLGRSTFQLQRKLVMDQLSAWQTQLGRGQVLTIPTDASWQGAAKQHQAKQLSVFSDDAESRRKSLDEIVLALMQLLEKDQPRVQLFVSHSADLRVMSEAASQIHQHAISDRVANAFFDVAELDPGEMIQSQMSGTVRRGVCIVVRGEAYSSRTWSQQELLAAKRNCLPTLTVDVFAKGERRSSPYGGNGPSIVWAGNPAQVVSRAMVEWLAAIHFRLEARRIAKAAGLPHDIVVHPRPPELLDLAQGPLKSATAQLVMHPDPELPVVERQILKAARPRLQLVTPTTAFRRLLNRADDIAAVTAPLQGFQVALSLSKSPDVDGPLGFTGEHVFDATVYLARSLISAGASIAYGGDLREQGYTPVLAELVRTYNQTAASPAELLHSYLAATITLDDAPALELTAHHLVQSPDVSGEALMPPPSDTEVHPLGLYFSDMRRVMARHVSARVILGGAAKPRTEIGPGYSGRYPGGVEEAWRTLEAQRPLYVAGGFGGAAALVADVLEGPDIPQRMQDQTWMHSEMFRKNAQAFDASPYRDKLGLPKRMQDLAEMIRELARPLLATDAESVAWNGLTVAENHLLFRTRDPVIIASLVLKGLLAVAREQSLGKLEIELIHGSVTTASNLDAIAIAMFDNIALGGAGAALDQAIGGRATAERAEGRRLVSLAAADIDADWLYLASLGPLPNVDELVPKIQAAAEATTEQALRHGFRRLGVVAFGGTILADVEQVAEAMLLGFWNLAGHATLVWFEANREQFDRLNKVLSVQPNVKLSTRLATTIPSVPLRREEELIIRVAFTNGELDVTLLPPAGSAIASSSNRVLSDETLASLVAGAGFNKRATPGLETLAARGTQLAELLMGEDASELLARCRDAKLVIIHDVAASRLPFEMLNAANHRPAVRAGMSRRLLVHGVPVDHLFAKPPKTRPLQVLLIVNPTSDLQGTESEADAVLRVLQLQPADVQVTKLQRNEATKQRILEELDRADILHYCGHAFFDGAGSDKSGLILAGKERLTMADLQTSNAMPRVAFVNACEAGRVRGSVTTPAAAFAEFFLRSGVEAYLGTYWEVGDTAAASFATGVYTRLAAGESLEAAVTKTRAELLAANEPDWSNYILYGDGRFKLVVR